MASAAFVTDLTEILTQATEAAAGIASVVNSFKVLDIAKDYYRLYKDQQDFYYNTFQNGLEAPLANEVYGLEMPTLDYAKRIGYMYDKATGPLGGKATDAEGWMVRHAEAYGATIPEAMKEEMKVDMLRVQSDWTNYMFRFEETYYDVLMDIRWKKRLTLHNIAIKSGTAVSSAMSGALGEYQQHIADFSSQLATYGNGIARHVGYKRGLADTAADFNRDEYSQTNRKVLDSDVAPKGLGVPDYTRKGVLM